MVATVVLGAQWGDEGKGKLVDILCPEQKLVCRAQGGNNAGHTIVANNVTYDFHILPSGLLNPNAINLVGSGCVVHIPGLLEELESLESKGLTDARKRLFISDRAHVVLDLHQKLDGIEEAELGGGKIGTTGKGIGPCYSTKASRSGIRMADIFQEEFFEKKIRALAAGFKKRFGDLLDYDPEEEIAKFKESEIYTEYRSILRTLVIDQVPLLLSAQQSKAPILIEGANALMLDIDAGTYPFVTSSNTGLGGVFTGLGGLNPRNVQSVIGVVKAYTTRVGGGPFPSELNDDLGVKLQVAGKEFGVTTGRPRRCGWLDLKILQYSSTVNSYTALNLTKLDILDDFPEVKIAMSYRRPGHTEIIEGFPADLDILGNIEVEYVTLKGWMQPIGNCKTYDELPTACREYVEFIEKNLNIPIKYIGVGPKREDMIVR
ncbi:Adenylosuccinate synthetase [Golovinomyces cichoracearum]|uniref:Adenylosuccinate synthetase n=1 Tax=Golovinomyces cichoracearum TaxID=62708 RepID=A0A420IRS5_9PEZI|nr:Adenylosuccinate synthetase [Golovinomyces cichoracearum]